MESPREVEDSTRFHAGSLDRYHIKHLLHVFPTFGIGGAEVHFAEILNRLGPGFRHTIISMDGQSQARVRLAEDIDVRFVRLHFNKHDSLRNIRLFRRVLKTLRPDLLTTCNWGTIEWAFANWAFPVCPHIHQEHGFGPQEVAGQISRRVLARRIALSRVNRLLVPSSTLKRSAKDVWRIKPHKIIHIPNGLDCSRFERGSGEPDHSGDIVIGNVGRLSKEKNITRLLRIFSNLPENPSCQLWIVGDGPECDTIRRQCSEFGLSGRVRIFGYVPDPLPLLKAMDIYALTSDSEQMPISVLEAMASTLPIVATDVGDLKSMVSSENADFIVEKENETGYLESLKKLVRSGSLRRLIGSKNREKCAAAFDIKIVAENYLKLFHDVMTVSSGFCP